MWHHTLRSSSLSSLSSYIMIIIIIMVYSPQCSVYYRNQANCVTIKCDITHNFHHHHHQRFWFPLLCSSPSSSSMGPAWPSLRYKLIMIITTHQSALCSSGYVRFQCLNDEWYDDYDVLQRHCLFVELVDCTKIKVTCKTLPMQIFSVLNFLLLWNGRQCKPFWFSTFCF